jgi:hypothetical protein
MFVFEWHPVTNATASAGIANILQLRIIIPMQNLDAEFKS